MSCTSSAVVTLDAGDVVSVVNPGPGSAGDCLGSYSTLNQPGPGGSLTIVRLQ